MKIYGETDTEYRRNANGHIDYDYYRAKGRHLRSQAFFAAGKMTVSAARRAIVGIVAK